MPDLSPSITVFISVLTAVVGLYILRIPQAARIMAQAFARLNDAQEKKIDQMQRDMTALHKQHEDCEKRADGLERRLRAIERGRR